MVSPELLRRSPFFAFTDEAQKKAIAMIAEECSCDAGAILFSEDQLADALFLLLEGSVDLYFTPKDGDGAPRENILVGEINPGEPFGLSALVKPHVLTATACASRPCRILKIEGAALRALCEVDDRMGHLLMRQMAKSVAERLHAVRLQLAATRG